MSLFPTVKKPMMYKGWLIRDVYNLWQSPNNLRCFGGFLSCGSVASSIPGQGHFRILNECPDASQVVEWLPQILDEFSNSMGMGMNNKKHLKMMDSFTFGQNTLRYVSGINTSWVKKTCVLNRVLKSPDTRSRAPTPRWRPPSEQSWTWWKGRRARGTGICRQSRSRQTSAFLPSSSLSNSGSPKNKTSRAATNWNGWTFGCDTSFNLRRQFWRQIKLRKHSLVHQQSGNKRKIGHHRNSGRQRSFARRLTVTAATILTRRLMSSYRIYSCWSAVFKFRYIS